MILIDLIDHLASHPAFNDATVVAMTPSGTFTFDIVNVEGDHNEPVLRLVERITERNDPDK